MPAVISTTGVIFGIPDEVKPLEDIPTGNVKVRFRFSCEDFAKAFVRTPFGIVGYHIKEEGGKWFPCFPFRINHTIIP